MRAAFCTGRGQIEVRDIPPPSPVDDEILVRVHACGICGSDLHYYDGGAAPPAVCLGHEISGRVASAGGGFALGDSVVVEPLLPCGACDRCRAGEPNLCPRLRILGSMASGGFAELVAVPPGSLYRIPAELDVGTAMLAEPLAVGVHAARLAQLTLGEEVLVLGGGAIGLLAAFAAVTSGARVTLSARYSHQASAARALGVAAVIGTGREEVLRATGERQPDVVLETVGGTAATLDLALEVVRAGGRIVALGKFTQPIALPPLRFLMKEVRLVSSMTYSRNGPRADFEIALALLARWRGRLATLITHRVPLADAPRGFAIAADKSTGSLKVAVTTELP